MTISTENAEILRAHVDTVENFPVDGVTFRDVTPILASRVALDLAVSEMCKEYESAGVDAVLAVESRGFIFGALVAEKLGAALHLLRKPGKIPPPFLEENYTLEYGSSLLQLKSGSISTGKKVLVVDDVIASGGTALAAVSLARRAGLDVAGVCALVDLPDLGGSQRITDTGVTVTSVLSY